MIQEFTRREFLEAVFRSYFARHDGFIMLKTQKKLDHRVSARYFPNMRVLAKEQFDNDHTVFFGPCPRETMKPGRESVKFMVAVWAGLDVGAQGFSGRDSYFKGPAHAAKAVRSFHLPPSIIVESGSGVHLYWLLKRPHEIEDVDEIEKLLTRLNNYFLCPKHISIDSVMRLPDTVNSKIMGEPFECRIRYINPEFTYDIGQFQWRPTDLITPPAKPETSPRMAEDGPMGGPREAWQEDEKAGAIDEAEVQEFLTQDRSREKFTGPLSAAGGKRQDPGQAVRPIEAPSEETLASQTLETLEAQVEICEENLTDEFVDRVAERVVEKLRETVVDEIVEKLFNRLTRNR